MEKKETKKESVIEKNKKQIVAIALALVVLLGGSYAWLQITLNGTKTTKIEAGTLKLEIQEATEGITLEETLPLSDTEGLATTAYEFTLENSGNITSEYTIYLDDIEIDSDDTRMDDSVIKYSITTNGGEATTALLSTTKQDAGRVLETGTIEPTNTNSYTLRLWIDSEATENDIHVFDENGAFEKGKVFKAKLRIEASQIKE